MKKMKVVSLFLIVFFSFFAFLDGVKAAVTNHDFNDRCNIGITIGANNERIYSGYGNVRISSDVEAHKGYGYSGIERVDPKSDEWSKKVQTGIYIHTKDSEKKITYFEIVFYHYKDPDNGEKKAYPLCTLSSNNTVRLTGDESFILFSFDLTEGHVYYANVKFKYESGEGVKTKEYKKNIKKELNGEGVYPTIPGTHEITTPAPDLPGVINPNQEAWYLCKKTKEEMKSEKSDSLSLPTDKTCIFADAFSDLGKRTCNKKRYDSESECKKALSNTEITTTTTTTTVTSDLPDLTHDMGSGDINKASKAKLNASDVTYNPLNGRMDCENFSVKDLIDEYWSYVMICVPIALILLISIDFFKALVSNNQDQLKKSSNDAMKRTLAAVILLMLPALLSMILGWVGLELCI